MAACESEVAGDTDSWVLNRFGGKPTADAASWGLSRKCEPPPVTDETGMGSAVFAELAASPVCHRVHGHTTPIFIPHG